jgi:hypothetical protein
LRCVALRCVAFGWCQCQLRAFASALLPTRLFNYAAWRRGRSRSSSAQPLGVNGALGIPVLRKVSAFLWRLHLACDVVHVDDVLVRSAPTRPALPDWMDSIPMSAALSDRPCQRRPERRATGQPWRAQRGKKKKKKKGPAQGIFFFLRSEVAHIGITPLSDCYK